MLKMTSCHKYRSEPTREGDLLDLLLKNSLVREVTASVSATVIMNKLSSRLLV